MKNKIIYTFAFLIFITVLIKVISYYIPFNLSSNRLNISQSRPNINKFCFDYTLTLPNDLIDRIEELPPRDEKALEYFLRRTKLIVRKAFSDDSEYLKEIGEVEFHPKIDQTSDIFENQRWIDEIRRLRKLFLTMKKDYQLSTGEQFQKTLGDKRDKFL